MVVTTLVIRALLFPIMGWNLRTQRRIQREQRQVAPQLNEIRKRYKGQTRKISEESQKVYAEHGISPFSSMSGCVPLLVQLPVLYGLYWGIRDVIGMDSTGASRVTFDALPKSFNFGFLWIHNVAQTIGQAMGSATSNVSRAAPSPTARARRSPARPTGPVSSAIRPTWRCSSSRSSPDWRTSSSRR